MVMLKELFDDAMKNIKQPKRGLGIPSQKIGVRGVYLMNCPRCKQGFMFQFRFIGENGERKSIQSVNLNRLKNRIEEIGHEWVIENEPLMRKTLGKLEKK
jgi:hypothetical protein